MDLRDQLQATLSGSYALGRELGGGGMSRVFVADELRLKRNIVVKVLSPELAQGISVGLPFYTMPWADMGPELQPRVADARRRLERLTPVEKRR